MTQAAVKSSFKINNGAVKIALWACAAFIAVSALLLSFTVGDYYIFNRISEYGFFFCISQWVKKAGMLLILAAVFFNCRRCADAVKYVLPLFVVLSCCLFSGFFDIEPPALTPADKVYNEINLNFPKWLNVTLFFMQNAALLACCALFILRDGFKVRGASFICLPAAFLAVMPLNIFENFFDVTKIPQDSFLRFRNFTVWHFLALCILVGATVGLYYFLKNKTREQQDKYLSALALTLLIQYHCKDSILLGDGYNVYRTVFAALPLFICNIGVYASCASVIFKKRALYAISFFIHAVGALTVFVYFGKDEMSNYGIFCSFSILYFCLTHCILFGLCVLPSALGHYKFAVKDCVIPLIYYCAVIIVAAIASTLVQNFIVNFEVDGYTITVGSGINPDTGLPFDMTPPNYAFTQVNPLPFDVPNLFPLSGAMQYINLFYVILVYIAYVCLFFAFFGGYKAFLAARRVVLGKWSKRAAEAQISGSYGVLHNSSRSEVAISDGESASNDESASDKEIAVAEVDGEIAVGTVDGVVGTVGETGDGEGKNGSATEKDDATATE